VIKSSVLFLCTGDSRRSQVAEGFLRALAGYQFEIASAGSEETPLDLDAEEAQLCSVTNVLRLARARKRSVFAIIVPSGSVKSMP
jgi:protein-tyrosine-phosphatase